MKKMKKELYRTPFSDGKKWFLISMISMVILSAYNLIISWLLQKIIDLAAGIDKTPFYQLALVSLLSFLVFIVFYFIFRYAHPKFYRHCLLLTRTCCLQKFSGLIVEWFQKSEADNFFPNSATI